MHPIHFICDCQALVACSTSRDDITDVNHATTTMHQILPKNHPQRLLAKRAQRCQWLVTALARQLIGGRDRAACTRLDGRHGDAADL